MLEGAGKYFRFTILWVFRLSFRVRNLIAYSGHSPLLPPDATRPPQPEAVVTVVNSNSKDVSDEP